MVQPLADFQPAPIDREEILGRQVAAREAAQAVGYDALLVIGRSFYDRPGDLAYLTNHFPPFPTTVFAEGARGMGHGVFVLPVEGENLLITDPRKYRADLVVADEIRDSADLGQAIVDVLKEKKLNSARIGLTNSDIFPATFDRQLRAQFPKLKLEDEPLILAKLRAIKSPAELDLLRRAALCADAALVTATAMVRNGDVTEREVCAEAISAAMKAGADFVRYFRVHSGPWSAAGSRWPQALDREIQPGEVVVFDAIGACQGYQFDVNRTTVCMSSGSHTRKLLETTLNATEAAVAAAIAGATVDDVAAAASAVMSASKFGDYFKGSLGHGIGLETVELPYLKTGGEEILEPGMVLCIEPGLFIPEVAGVAIEQEVIICEEGPPEVITPTPTRLW